MENASYVVGKKSVFFAVDGDPHFIIELPQMNDALCFNIDDEIGTIFNLVRDPVLGKENFE